MEPESGVPAESRSRYAKVLLILTSIYGILYVALFLSFFLFEDFEFSITLEGVFVAVAGIVFIVGYYYTWKSPFAAGLIFVGWWGIMWILGLFVAETDKGAGVVMGIPLFIIALLLIHQGYSKR